MIGYVKKFDDDNLVFDMGEFNNSKLKVKTANAKHMVKLQDYIVASLKIWPNCRSRRLPQKSENLGNPYNLLLWM